MLLGVTVVVVNSKSARIQMILFNFTHLNTSQWHLRYLRRNTHAYKQLHGPQNIYSLGENALKKNYCIFSQISFFI